MGEVPSSIGELIHLRYLNFSYSRIRSLPNSNCSNLQGVLSISGLQEVVDVGEARAANLKDKKKIEELTMEWRDPSFSVMVELTLRDCKKCMLLPNLGGLSVLKVLCIEGMSQVKSIGAEFYGESMNPFASLKVLRFEDMPEWENWSHSNFIKEDVGTFPHLEKFFMRKCPKLIGELPKCLQSLVALQELVIKDCDGLTCLWEEQWLPCNLKKLEIRDCANLEKLSNGLQTLTRLEELEIRSCPKLESFPDSGFPPVLRRLELFYCRGLKSLPHNYNTCPLEVLAIQCSPFLKCFPNGELPTTLKKLYIWDCQRCLDSLRKLDINDCGGLECFPERGLSIPNLEFLEIEGCENLKSLTHQMRNLKSLRSLTISQCPGLESFPEEGLAPNLTSLEIDNCKNLKTPISEWGLDTLTSLSELTIRNIFPNMVSVSDEECLLPISLTSLTIKGMESLESLESLDLDKLISLRSLDISNCPNLRSLGLLPATLAKLDIFGCPTMKERFSKDGGECWSNVAHIRSVRIGN
ncbi:unnamed protein product, partial [Vitis vinifera]